MKTELVDKPVHFFAITFLFAWICGFIAAYFSYQDDMQTMLVLFIIPVVFSPSIAALVMLSGANNHRLAEGFLGKAESRQDQTALSPGNLADHAVCPIPGNGAFIAVRAVRRPISALQRVCDHRWTNGAHAGHSAPGTTFEEVGWRGYGEDSIRSRFNLFTTTVLFGVLWGLWHVPLFFINGYYQHDLWNTSIVYVINFFAQILVATILMNWLYYRNNRSITAAILFHFMLNLFSVLFQTEQFTKCIITIVMLMIAMVIIARNRAFFFNEANTHPSVALKPVYE